MQQRCENPQSRVFHNYGGRGIQFRFSSARSAAEWIKCNLGLRQDLVLDRIDNNGHYEPGNLRWVSHSMNNCNTRRGGWVAKFHKFRLDHPDIRYADKTLKNLFSLGFTSEQIIARYNRPSDKPKGVYGTYSTADPAIASLAKDC